VNKHFLKLEREWKNWPVTNMTKKRRRDSDGMSPTKLTETTFREWAALMCRTLVTKGNTLVLEKGEGYAALQDAALADELDELLPESAHK
jgi:hypothetical protein